MDSPFPPQKMESEIHFPLGRPLHNMIHIMHSPSAARPSPQIESEIHFLWTLQDPPPPERRDLFQIDANTTSCRGCKAVWPARLHRLWPNSCLASIFPAWAKMVYKTVGLVPGREAKNL